MKKTYNPEIELAKGAALTARSYDKTQTVAVTAAKVTVGGQAGEFVVAGIATGRADASIDGTMSVWLAIFRYMRPDGTVNHVAGWNITVALTPGQKPAATAKAFADYINTGKRPYKASAAGATVKIVYND